MAGIDEVLERLVAEPEFREQLRADPAVALSGYVLDVEDLEVLAFTLDESEGGDHTVEQRTSKSGLAGMLSALGGDEVPDDVASPASTAEAKREPYLKWELKNVQVTSTQARPDADPGDDLTDGAKSAEAPQVSYPGVYVQEDPPPPPPAEIKADEPTRTEMPQAWEDGELVAIDSVESFLDAPPPADEVLASAPVGQDPEGGAPGATDEPRDHEPEARPDDRPDGRDDQPPRDTEPGRSDEPPRNEKPPRDDDGGAS